MLVGNVVDQNFASQLPQFDDKTITPDILGYIAWGKNADAQFDAQSRVNGAKNDYGNGVSTLMLIYNASGGDLHLDWQVDDSGHFWTYPADSNIGNGLWSWTLHVHSSGSMCGSVGILAYRMYDSNVLLIAWNNPYNHAGNNKATAWCKVVSDGWYGNCNKGQLIQSAVDGPASGSNADLGYDVQWSLGNTSSPQFVVTVHKTNPVIT